MVRYGPETALIVVDVQNDFADPAGGLSVAGGEALIEPINREVALATAGGGVLSYTQDWHPPATPHFAKDGGVWPVHCVGGTWGAELHPRLDVAPGAIVVRKGTSGEDGYSGFTVRDARTGETSPTSLDGRLRAAGVTHVLVVGLATDYCVKATALDAVSLGYATSVLAGCVAPVDLQPGDGDRALDEMRAAGVEVVVPTATSGAGGGAGRP